MKREDRIENVCQFVLQERDLLATPEGHIAFVLTLHGILDEYFDQEAHEARGRRKRIQFSEN